MTVQLLPISAADYVPHRFHRDDRCWTETNCYVDVWIEVLHSLGLEPSAAGAFTLSTDFLGDQWTFFKYPPEDLRALYGIDVFEMNIWLPLDRHIEEQLGLGRLLTVEADSFYLPDTLGIAYQERHQKSTIVPQLIDRDRQVLGYFHNAGYFELVGEDFVGALGLARGASALPPYVEMIRLDRVVRDEERLIGVARLVLVDHLRRRPLDNPLARLAKRVAADLPWIQEMGLERFHDYAFATCRQCGAWAESAASFLSWFSETSGEPLQPAAASFMEIAVQAKSAEFALARAAAGRRCDVDEQFEQMAAAWALAMRILDEHYGQ